MNEQRTKELISFYPEIFPLDFTFETGDGWYQIISNISFNIWVELQSLNWKGFTNFRVLQVKQKFGTLRYYVSQHNENILNSIRAGEYLSSWTCETCGMPGCLGRYDGYDVTLCEVHKEEWINKKL